MNRSMSVLLSITNSWSLPEFMSIESVMPFNHLILCHPLLLLLSIFPSIRVFSNESALRIRWPKFWSFSFNISPSSEYWGLTSFRMDWLDLLAVQGTLKSLLQHHSSKASILWRSAFFIVQLSHPYMTTGKTIVLTRWTFVDLVRWGLSRVKCLRLLEEDLIMFSFKGLGIFSWCASYEQLFFWLLVGALLILVTSISMVKLMKRCLNRNSRSESILYYDKEQRASIEIILGMVMGMELK